MEKWQGSCLDPNTRMQDYSLHELLEENLKLTRENNKMLKRMRRAALIGRIVKFLFVLAVLFALYYAYVNYIQPNYQDLKATFVSLQAEVGRVKELEDKLPESVQRLFGGEEESLNETE